MTFLLSLIISMSSFAENAVPSSAPVALKQSAECQAGLELTPTFEHKPARFSSGALITNLLTERGKALGATNIGLVETWMKNGETLISAIHFTTDGSRPVPEEVVKAFRSRMSRRVHQVERVNVWELDLVGGGVVVRSHP